MRRAEVILVAAMAIPLAGCLLKGNPKPAASTPAPPQPVAAAPGKEPLSIPQTQEYLPPYQPVVEAALKTAPAEAAQPAPQKPPATQATPPRSATGPKPGTTAKPPEVTAAAPPSPSEPPRQPIQEILPADVQKQFQEHAQAQRAKAEKLWMSAEHRRLTTNEKGMVVNIRQFIAQSDQAEKSGDMRSADEFAQKAFLLAEELQRGR